MTETKVAHPRAILRERLAGLSPNDVTVLIHLATFKNSDSLAWPQWDTLSKATGLGVRTVGRSLSNLRDRKMIEVVRSGRETAYKVLLDPIFPNPDGATPSDVTPGRAGLPDQAIHVTPGRAGLPDQAGLDVDECHPRQGSKSGLYNDARTSSEVTTLEDSESSVRAPEDSTPPQTHPSTPPTTPPKKSRAKKPKRVFPPEATFLVREFRNAYLENFDPEYEGFRDPIPDSELDAAETWLKRHGWSPDRRTELIQFATKDDHAPEGPRNWEGWAHCIRSLSKLCEKLADVDREMRKQRRRQRETDDEPRGYSGIVGPLLKPEDLVGDDDGES